MRDGSRADEAANEREAAAKRAMEKRVWREAILAGLRFGLTELAQPGQSIIDSTYAMGYVKGVVGIGEAVYGEKINELYEQIWTEVEAAKTRRSNETTNVD
jgi:hypothetical protein